MRALEAGLDPATVLRMARAFEQIGAWSVSAAVTDSGQSLAQAWLLRLTEYNPPDPPSSEALDFLLDGEPLAELLARDLPTRDLPGRRKTLARKILERLSSRNLSYRVADFFWSPTLFSALPREELERFKRYDHDSLPPGHPKTRDDIFRKAVHESRIEVALVLLERGWSWIPKAGNSAAMDIASPQGWSLFLTTGGDPWMEVEHQGHEDKLIRMPLWKYLLSHCAGDSPKDTENLKTRVHEWAQANASRELSSKELDDYWRRLDRYGNLQDVMSRIRARKDWALLENPAGENVLMVGLRNHLGVVGKLAQVARATALFSQVDKAGWSLWHHLLERGKGVSDSDWKLAQAHAPARPDPNRGLLCSLASKGPLGHKALPEATVLEALGKGPGALSPEDWWAGSSEDLERLASSLAQSYWGDRNQGGFFSPARVPKCLAALVRAFPPPDQIPPNLAAVLAFNELVNAAGGHNDDGLGFYDHLVASGAALSIGGKALEQMEKTASLLPTPLQSRFTQLRLSASLSPPSSGPSKPRL